MTVEALSSLSVQRTVGGVWDIVVAVRNEDGYQDDAALTVTITLPGGATATPTVEAITTGVHRLAYPLMQPGRYTAIASTASLGSVAFAAYAESVTTAAGMPDIDALDRYIGLGEHSWTDDDLQDALDAEAAAQRSVCRVGAVYPADLRSALLRRAQRNLAMRKLPLAVLTGDSESGPDILPGNDPEVRRLERPWRKLPIA